MFPTLYQINEGIGIHTYGIMIMMGLLAALYIVLIGHVKLELTVTNYHSCTC